MRCPACEHEQPPGGERRTACGVALPRSCRECGVTPPADARFCPACGQPVAGAARTRPAAERRHIPAVCLDLVDSTALAERLDPEEFRELVRAFYRICEQAIDRAGGHLAKYLGDGVMAYFGHPVAREHDARSAVRAALAIVNAVLRGDVDGGRVELAVRAGLHTGLVVVDDVASGSDHDLTVGNALNLAARLQALARPNGVVMSAVTHRLTEGLFLCRDLGLKTVKGIATPIHVYEVEDESGAESRLEATAGVALTPLVGRDFELTALLDCW